MGMFEAMEGLPHNKTVVDNFIKAYSYINRHTYDKILCTVSGGWDSEIVVDICTKCDKDKKIEYVNFNSGLEYEATRRHLKEMEEKYGIEIKTYRPKKPVPIAVKEKGVPFLNKRVSQNIQGLQKVGFDWKDAPYEELLEKYPRSKAYIMWWCNEWGENSRFNISRNKWLKEFMIQNPPTFPISDKCCDLAKKSVLHELMKNGKYDLNIYGVRKAEGGQRATAYKGCFTDKFGGCDEYRPIFWYTDADKKEYCDACGVVPSDCYTVYGLDRTGCAGCPFGKYWEQELMAIEIYEPKLFKAVNNIFGLSYEYTRQYKEFARKKNEEQKNGFSQMSIYDYA